MLIFSIVNIQFIRYEFVYYRQNILQVFGWLQTTRLSICIKSDDLNVTWDFSEKTNMLRHMGNLHDNTSAIIGNAAADTAAAAEGGHLHRRRRGPTAAAAATEGCCNLGTDYARHKTTSKSLPSTIPLP